MGQKCRMALQFEKCAENRCRICLKVPQKEISVHSKVCAAENEIVFTEMLFMCIGLEISTEDKKPQTVCQKCLEDAKMCYIFKLTSQKSQRVLEEELLKVYDGDNVKKRLLLDDSTGDTSNIKNDYKTTESPSSTTKNSICDQCGKEFSTQRNLQRHKKLHESRPKTCEFCDYLPESIHKLSKHMEQKHEDKKTVVCPACGKRFFKRANLRLHTLTHTGVKKYTCEICGVSFALSGNLTAHKRLHTGEKPFECHQCGKTFTQQAALRSHEASHATQRDHGCAECGARFTRANALKNHQKRHRAERPFKCSMCDRAFTFSSERNRHMMTHTGVRLYACEVCGKRFNRNSNLKVHLRTHSRGQACVVEGLNKIPCVMREIPGLYNHVKMEEGG